MSPRRFAAIVLAAGLSARMKEFKPLLPLGNDTVTDTVISTLSAADVDIILVTGHRHEDMNIFQNRNGVSVVYNPEYQKGMFTSVRAGARRLERQCHAFFVLPVDIPLVKASSISQMIEVASKHPGLIIYPTYRGKRGHPPLIPSGFIPEILHWEKEGGLKSFLEAKNRSACEIPVDDEFILEDIDTPEDYERLLVKFR